MAKLVKNTTEDFRGTISSDRTKDFLVDLLALGGCDSLDLDCVASQYDHHYNLSIFDDNADNGVSVRVRLAMKKREGEDVARLADNKAIWEFAKRYGLYLR